MAKRSDAAEMLVLFWLLRRSQVALSPLGVGLALNRIVVKVLARVSVSLASPFRRRPSIGHTFLPERSPLQAVVDKTIMHSTNKVPLRFTSSNLCDCELHAPPHRIYPFRSHVHSVAMVPGKLFGFCAASTPRSSSTAPSLSA
jgi:hypothetical protein